ncbi:MAG TPA: MBL fold metallo-hydrolase [Verrucomicrobiae bacterium]|nr:MBL fold metallo-hydrolase [Verrucomicrobiae bacterium]
MRVTFLGTGTSHGIPMIGCDCPVCLSDNPRNKRLRPSVYIEKDGHCLLIDATPDFRTQALRANIRRVDAVLMTHTHADHVLGLDDLRVFCRPPAAKMPIYGSPHSVETIRRMFPYACSDKPAWPGLPSFELHTVEASHSFEASAMKIQALPVDHGRMAVFGFLMERDVAYITDCKTVSSEVVEAIRGVPLLVLDALRYREHPTHLTIAEACAMAERVGAGLTLFTHLCHEVEHEAVEKALPAGVRVAYDGMRVEVNDGDVRCLE